MTNLTDIVRKSANFTDNLCEKLLDDMCESEATLFAIKYRWENTLNPMGIYESHVSSSKYRKFLIILIKTIKTF